MRLGLAAKPRAWQAAQAPFLRLTIPEDRPGVRSLLSRQNGPLVPLLRFRFSGVRSYRCRLSSAEAAGTLRPEQEDRKSVV